MLNIHDLLKRFSGSHGVKAGNRDAVVEEAIEHVVDSIDSKLRLVPSYKNKLREAVSVSLSHISDLVDQVPGPYNFSRAAYINDPDIRSYFASADLMQDVFSSSPELQAFFSNSENAELETGYALLCSNKEEKTVTGSELVGDAVQRDVMQIAINFYDYKVLSPASSDYEVRKGIKQCIFDGLITHALRHIAEIKIERRDLHDQQRILHAQLRARQARGNGLSSMLTEGHADEWQAEKIEQQYIDAGKKLDGMLGKQDVLSFYLDEVRSILAKPEEFIQLNVACFRLSDMRIKLDDNATQAANTVCFSELEIANVLRRVVAVASYSRNEMKYSH